jgi:hypothetical protein
MFLETLCAALVPRRRGCFVAALASLSGVVWAHHGDAGRWEEETITLTGTVVAVQLINPHSSIIFDVAGEDGKTVRWQAEFSNPRNLATNFGWNRNTLQAGDRITMVGRPIRSGAPYFNLSERANIVRTDTCEELFRTRSEPDPPAPGSPCAE